MSSIIVAFNVGVPLSGGEVRSAEISGIEFLSSDFVVQQTSENMPPLSGQYAVVTHITKDIVVYQYGDGIYRVTLEDP